MSNRRSHANPSDSRRYYDWLDRAEEDMYAASVLMKEDNCYLTCAFHCQQAIEKALKAYVLFKSTRLLDGHNLTWLCRQAIRYDKKFIQWLDESASLNRCYIETRYPTDIPFEFGYEQMISAYNMAREMYAFICEEIEGK